MNESSVQRGWSDNDRSYLYLISLKAKITNPFCRIHAICTRTVIVRKPVIFFYSSTACCQAELRDKG